MSDRDHVIELEQPDEADGVQTLKLLGWRYGIENSPENVELRAGSYVRLTKRGERELLANNRRAP